MESILQKDTGIGLKCNQITQEQIYVIKALAKAAAKQNCLFMEIGSWSGDSAVILGKIARENEGKLFCVDWWKGSIGTPLENIASSNNIFSIFWDRIIDEGLDSTVVPIRTSSDTAAQILRSDCFDLIFIDGDHRYEQITKDIKQLKNAVKKDGGIFSGHDCEGKPWEFHSDFLESGKEVDAIDHIHCGVVLAVAETFENYSVNQSIWSVQYEKGADKFQPTSIELPEHLRQEGNLPVFVLSENGYNVIKYKGSIYLVAQALGEIDITSLSRSDLDNYKINNTILVLDSVDEAERVARITKIT